MVADAGHEGFQVSRKRTLWELRVTDNVKWGGLGLGLVERTLAPVTPVTDTQYMNEPALDAR